MYGGRGEESQNREREVVSYKAMSWVVPRAVDLFWSDDYWAAGNDAPW